MYNDLIPLTPHLFIKEVYSPQQYTFTFNIAFSIQ